MKAEDFAAWLAAISGMSSAQRAEAFATLEKAGAGGADAVAESSGQGPGKRGRREDALGTTSLERVEAQGCPHCAGREIVGWGRSHGLLRFRCKSCGRTFNGLTKTGASAQEGEMARARARDDRGQEPGQDRATMRRSSDDRLPLAASVSARACRQQAANAARDCRSGRNLHPRILQRPVVRPAARSA